MLLRQKKSTNEKKWRLNVKTQILFLTFQNETDTEPFLLSYTVWHHTVFTMPRLFINWSFLRIPHQVQKQSLWNDWQISPSQSPLHAFHLTVFKLFFKRNSKTWNNSTATLNCNQVKAFVPSLTMCMYLLQCLL